MDRKDIPASSSSSRFTGAEVNPEETKRNLWWLLGCFTLPFVRSRTRMLRHEPNVTGLIPKFLA